MANKTLIIKMDPSATFTGGSTASSGIATYNNKIITGVGTGNTNLTLNFASSKISSRTFNKVFNIKVSKSAAQQKVDTLQAEYDAACAAITEVQNWFKNNNISTLNILVAESRYGYSYSLTPVNGTVTLNYPDPTKTTQLTWVYSNNYTSSGSRSWATSIGDTSGSMKIIPYVYAGPYTTGMSDTELIAYNTKQNNWGIVWFNCRNVYFIVGYNITLNKYCISAISNGYCAYCFDDDGYTSSNGDDYAHYVLISYNDLYVSSNMPFNNSINVNFTLTGYHPTAGSVTLTHGNAIYNYLLGILNNHRYPGTILTELNNAKASV